MAEKKVSPKKEEPASPFLKDPKDLTDEEKGYLIENVTWALANCIMEDGHGTMLKAVQDIPKMANNLTEVSLRANIARSDATSAKSEVLLLQQGRSTLEGKLGALERKLDGLDLEQGRQCRDIDSADHRISVVEMENRELKEENKGLKKEVQLLRKDLDSLRTVMKELSSVALNKPTQPFMTYTYDTDGPLSGLKIYYPDDFEGTNAPIGYDAHMNEVTLPTLFQPPDAES